MQNRSAIGLCVILFSGCQHSRLSGDYPAEQLLKSVCALPRVEQQIEGEVWIQAESKDLSGQFPADVRVSPGGKLLLEISHLFGGTAARIEGDRDRMVITRPDENKTYRASKSWAGIPLEWAPLLFVGQMPCMAGGRVEKPDSDQVRVASAHSNQQETYLYSFRKWAGSPWADRMRWERGGRWIEISFDDPEERSGVAMRWSVRSSEGGEVTVRWKHRRALP